MNDLTVVYYTDIHCIIDIKKEIEMTNYETLQQICERAKENIDMLNASGKLDALSKCIAFVDDLHKWVSYCDNLKNYILVEEAQTECINSIYMCAQGFYKEAMTTLRQFFEHMLFAILLSTNDYKYRLWQVGKYDMSWSQIVDDQNGIFGKQFISVYAVLQIKVNRFCKKSPKKYSADSRVKMRTANRTPSKIGGSQMTK